MPVSFCPGERGKIIYHSLKDAKAAVARMSKFHGTLVAYLCRDCGKYHIGHDRFRPTLEAVFCER